MLGWPMKAQRAAPGGSSPLSVDGRITPEEPMRAGRPGDDASSAVPAELLRLPGGALRDHDIDRHWAPKVHRFENDPRVFRRIEQARRSLRAGQGASG